MSKLNVDQKTIMSLFSEKKADFIIPDYQRPYTWKEEKECQILWDDIFAFAFPDNNCDKFDSNEEYFLGAIVTFENDKKKKEIIDGQQRLITLMLLLRAFYAKFGNMRDESSKRTRERISQCLWKTDEFGQADLDSLKIDSEVATDEDKDEFLEILKTGIVSKEQKSNYAKNYRFFQEKIDNFLSEYPSYFAYLPARILGNCILLPIEADSQDTALRIFSTLNDRGLPLSDADIFKAQFYKYYNAKKEKDSFIEKWKELEEITGKIFKSSNDNNPMDELFTRYMYFVRAKKGIKSSTTESLRKFYEKDKYAILKQDETLLNLKILAIFWNDIHTQNEEIFSTSILRKLFILKYAPNGMWTYFLSVYFLHNKDENEQLEEKKLEVFLDKMIAFIWGFSFIKPGVNALRTPVYTEMINIVTNKPVNFEEHKFEEKALRNTIDDFEFKNNRPITRSMLTWWAFRNKKTPPTLDTNFHIEHIFAKKRQENDKLLDDFKNLEVLGNKSLLESKINIRVSDYRFIDKKKYYIGFINDKGIVKNGSIISELVNLAKSKDDFTEKDIINRNNDIINQFIKFLKQNDLIK